MRKIVMMATLMLMIMMVSASVVEAGALRRQLRGDAWRDRIQALRSASALNEAAPRDYSYRYRGTLQRRGKQIYETLAARAAAAEKRPRLDLEDYYQSLKTRSYLRVYGDLAQYGARVQHAPIATQYKRDIKRRVITYKYTGFKNR